MARTIGVATLAGALLWLTAQLWSSDRTLAEAAAAPLAVALPALGLLGVSVPRRPAVSRAAGASLGLLSVGAGAIVLLPARAGVNEPAVLLGALGAAATFAGLALATVSVRGPGPLSFSLGVLALLSALLIVFRYIFSINLFADAVRLATPYGPLWLGALLLLAIAAGIVHTAAAGAALSTRPERLSRTMVLWLLPLALVLPVTVGWVRWMGESAGLYETAFGLAIFSLTSSAVLAGMILYTASRMRRVEGERERFALETRTSRDALAQTLERISDAFLALDLEWRFTYVNAHAEKYFGHAREELIGTVVWDLAPQARDTIFGRTYTEALASGTPRSFEAISPLTGHWVEVHAYPGPNGLSVFFRDVNERKQAEEERARVSQRLRRLTAELSRSNADLQQFAYVVSHDLQEPLRGIAGCVHLLERRYGAQLDDRARELITHAVLGAERMEAMINSLLDYSRINTRSEAFEPVDLDEPLDDALTNLRSALQRSGAVIERTDLPVAAVDRMQIGRVFQNLLANAVKFQCARPLRIQIGAEQDGAETKIVVRDNGIGIEPRFFERIFGMFQRLHTVGEYPGTGIGLAIARRIVERHGGRMGVASVPGEGSAFYFTLPARREEG